MDSRFKNVVLAVVAIALTAVGFWHGTGLEPEAWLLWVVTIPVLLVVQRLGLLATFLVGFLAFALGGLNLWSYLEILPLVPRLAAVLIPALGFGLALLTFRICLKRGLGALAVFVFPCCWGAFEYLASLASPHGTFGHLAYTQIEFLAIVQLASLAGVWVIDFLPLLVSATLSVFIGYGMGWNELSFARLKRGFVVGACLLGFAAVWSFAHLRGDVGGAEVRVGLLGSDLEENDGMLRPELSAEILDRYLAVVPEAKVKGAEVLVMPEHLIAVSAEGGTVGISELEFRAKVREVSRSQNVDLVLGVDYFEESTASNQAWYVSRGGEISTYTKRHLLPGFESRFSAGNSETIVSMGGDRAGLAICKDLDFPAVASGYAQKGIGLLFVPAYDFHEDAWLHSRMAVMRGVESGLSVVRSARDGLLTVSDSRGRILSEVTSGKDALTLLVCDVPIGKGETVYARFGDWFAWLELLGLVLILGFTMARKRTAV